MTIRIRMTSVNISRIMSELSHLEDLCQIIFKKKNYLISKKSTCLPTSKFLNRRNMIRYSV